MKNTPQMIRSPKFFKGNIREANRTVWEWTESVRISARISARIGRGLARIGRVSCAAAVRTDYSILCVSLRILCVY